MKKLIIFLIIVCFNFMGLQYIKASRLTIFSYGNTGFSLEIDGHYYGMVRNKFSFDNIYPGLYKIKIYKYVYNGFSHINTLTYRGMIRIPEKTSVHARVNRFGKVKVIKVLPLEPPLIYGSEIFIPEPSPYAYAGGMDNPQFLKLKQIISKQAFDNSRLRIAKQAIRYNGISSSQLLELMVLFSFDSAKLKLAKYAHPFVTDKENFFLVNRAFNFDSSVNNLYHYINRY